MATYYKARGTYNDRDLSASDAAKVAQYKKQYETAKAAGDTAGMNAAHAAAEQVRSGYGYSGGGDGSERIGRVTETYGGRTNSGAGSTSGGTARNTGSANNQNSAVSNANAALSGALAGGDGFQRVINQYEPTGGTGVVYSRSAGGAVPRDEYLASRAGAVPNATQTLTGVTAAADGLPTNYDLGAITDQASALNMMKLGSNSWNNAGQGAAGDFERRFFSNANQQIVDKWFPGATRDSNGVWYYNGSPLYDQDFSGSTYQAQMPLANAAAQMAGLNGYTATSPDGMTYSIGSEKGINFLTNAAAGETMTGGDGSQWTKNADGSVTITKNGRTYTYGGGQQAYTPTLMDQYGPQIAQSLSGEKYTIGSDTGLDFLYNGGVGTSMVGGDGSVWVKNADGSVNIYKNGQTYTIQGNPVGQPEMPEFTPFEQTEMGQSMWSGWQDLYDRLNNYEPFSYDPNTDPLYLQYADSYTRGGQRAMTDVLGQLAARTGGLASSYAGSMAQQTYDNYMADLAGKIPELQQLAYSMYVDDYNRAVGDYERAYNQFGDYSDQYNQNYQMGLNAYNTQMDNLWKGVELAQSQSAEARNNYIQQQQLAAQLAATERANRIEDAQIEYSRRQDARQETQASIADLWDQVNRYGRKPSLNTVLSLGLTEADYWEMVGQAERIRASDATRWYGGW